MNIPGWRSFGRVDVGVGVEPDQPDLFASFAKMRRDPGERADRDAVVAAEDDREGPSSSVVRKAAAMLAQDAAISLRYFGF